MHTSFKIPASRSGCTHGHGTVSTAHCSFTLTVTLLFIALLFAAAGQAQIGPPGMGDVRWASWGAMGITQRLDTAGHNTWTGYLGHGRRRTMQHEQPWGAPAILVIDQQLSHRFHEHWHGALGLSYRQQEQYGTGDNGSDPAPGMKQECRVHARAIHKFRSGHWRSSLTLRQEFRLFYDPAFAPWTEDEELRTRFKLQAERGFGRNEAHAVVVSMEHLFATDHTRSAPQEWTPLGYRECRAGAYFVERGHGIWELALGGMCDFVRSAHPLAGSYLVASVVLRDPFGHHRN